MNNKMASNVGDGPDGEDSFALCARLLEMLLDYVRHLSGCSVEPVKVHRGHARQIVEGEGEGRYFSHPSTSTTICTQ
jgi:hypothetical protein